MEQQLSFLGLGLSFEVEGETSAIPIPSKRIHNIIPTYFKQDKIKKDINEWNTIKHIYRYQTLYRIYNKLFMLTYNKKLKCLTYYIENDDNFMYAVNEELTALSLKERVLGHIKLLRQVYSCDRTLEYDVNKKVITDSVTLFG